MVVSCFWVSVDGAYGEVECGVLPPFGTGGGWILVRVVLRCGRGSPMGREALLNGFSTMYPGQRAEGGLERDLCRGRV